MSIQGDTYTPDQLNAYFSRISFPRSKYGDIKLEIARSKEGLSYLTPLQKYQLAHVPFENLSLHYSPHRMISLDKEDLFEKIVTLERGGYCMENNLLFATVLRTLGFEVVATGARVGPNAWDHEISLVRLGEDIFVVDVGFGSQGPTRPLRLVHGDVSKWGATDAEMRLIYHQPNNSFVQGTWTYEHRNSSAHEWNQMYTFTMTEFIAKDFDVMSYATPTRRSVWFTHKIVCMKLILDEEAGDIIGAWTLEDRIFKKRIRDKKEVLAECSTEEERIAGLEKYFGIFLTEKEQASIKGTVTSLA